MTLRTFVLLEDTLPRAAHPVYLPGGRRALYVRTGSVGVGDETGSQFLWAGSALVQQGEATLQPGEDDAVVWRWELADDDSYGPEHFALRSAPQTTTEVKLVTTVDLDDRYTWLMRCDTVAFPPGGAALTHLHQGPGIRITLDGEITIETEGTRSVYRAGEAWAEKGVLPVYAPTWEQAPTEFVRCFLLPKHNKGVSSLRIVDEADQALPNTQKYRVLSERVLT
ncbi:MAG: hypothetical protein GEV07_24580 [Streptosporangiales bacterium]|nr:hypothetical protein [Streptosporangiales bacterium]